MTRFTFLGMGEAALSMFIETLYAVHGNNFSLRIVRNLNDEPEARCDYLIPGLECEICSINDWQAEKEASFIIGVNLVGTKRAVFNHFESVHGIGRDRYLTLVHPAAVVSATIDLSAGVILGPKVVLMPFCAIHELATIGRCVGIGHHSTVGEFSTVHPAANIAGHCRIGRNVTIGMGANILEGISIGDNSVIGAGSLVTKDIPENVTALGSPARVRDKR